MKKIWLYFAVLTVGCINAQIGIGTINPEADLHLHSNKEYLFTLLDGKSNSDNYVLTAFDETGRIEKIENTVFNTIKFTNLKTTNSHSFSMIPENETFTRYYKGEWLSLDNDLYLSLSEGRWAVFITSLLTVENPELLLTDDFLNTTVTVEIHVIDKDNLDSPDITSPDVEGNALNDLQGKGSAVGALVFPTIKDLIRGTIIVHNTNAGIKNYYFAVRFIVNTDSEKNFEVLKNLKVNSILDDSLENQIYAIPLN